MDERRSARVILLNAAQQVLLIRFDIQRAPTLRVLGDARWRRILPFGERSAAAYAELVTAANAVGNPIDFAVAAIGAIALEHGFILATRNERDFKGTSVKLLNPWV